MCCVSAHLVSTMCSTLVVLSLPLQQQTVFTLLFQHSQMKRVRSWALSPGQAASNHAACDICQGLRTDTPPVCLSPICTGYCRCWRWSCPWPLVRKDTDPRVNCGLIWPAYILRTQALRAGGPPASHCCGRRGARLHSPILLLPCPVHRPGPEPAPLPGPAEQPPHGRGRVLGGRVLGAQRC